MATTNDDFRVSLEQVQEIIIELMIEMPDWENARPPTFPSSVSEKT